MPFTISHAAAALPVHALIKSRLPLAALMVGSMAPDFAYFLPGDVGRFETHSIAGIFLFCLPVGLAVWLFFATLLERPTLAFLPHAWRTRIAPSARLSRWSLLAAAVSIVLGAFTHLGWDAFTHTSTVVTETWPVFRAGLFDVGGKTVRVYFVLQVLSSVFGLVVLMAWANGIRKRPPLPPDQCVPEPSPRILDFERVLALLFIGAMSCAVGFFNVARDHGLQGNSTIFHMLIGAMTGAALGWTVVAITLRFRSRSRTPQGPAARFGQRS
jgi:hypothetical protein